MNALALLARALALLHVLALLSVLPPLARALEDLALLDVLPPLARALDDLLNDGQGVGVDVTGVGVEGMGGVGGQIDGDGATPVGDSVDTMGPMIGADVVGASVSGLVTAGEGARQCFTAT